MRVEDFEVRLCIVDLIFGLNRVDEHLELDQSAVLLANEDDFCYFAEIGKYVVKAVMIVLLGQRSGKQNLRRTIFL